MFHKSVSLHFETPQLNMLVKKCAYVTQSLDRDPFSSYAKADTTFVKKKEQTTLPHFSRSIKMLQTYYFTPSVYTLYYLYVCSESE